MKVLFVFLIFLFVHSKRRNVFELAEAGEISLDTVFYTQDFVDQIKKDIEKEGLNWIPAEPHESPFLGMSIRDFKKKIINPEKDEKYHEELHKELRSQNIQFEWKGKREVVRRNLPTSHIFYYPSENGAYDNCYDTTKNPVKDQEQCGSCYANAAVQMYDDRTCKAHTDQGYESWLVGSVQSILSCNLDTSNNAFDCDGGSVYSVLKSLYESCGDTYCGMYEDECLTYKTYQGGDCTPSYYTCVEHDYTCPGNSGTCDDDSLRTNADKLFCKSGTVTYTSSYEHSASQQLLYDGGPMVSAFDTYSDFSSYKSGVYQRSSSATISGSHAIVVMGWGYHGSIPVWYCKNSWGPGWGDNGFFKMERSLVDGSDITNNGVRFARRWYSCLPEISNHACFGIRADRSYVCSGHGTCTGNDQCSCNSGWGGSSCQNVVTTNCNPTCNAANGGVCQENGSNDYCTCSAGWDPNDGCNTPTCSGGCTHGSCTGPNTCTCNAGWYGTNCDKAITCSPSCANGGTCKAKADNSGTYCDCSSTGYEGSYCQTPVCAQTCNNGGSCTSPNQCTCVNGWSGSDCSTATCSPTCKNGGSCNAPNKCSCTSYWSGDTCETPVCTKTCYNGGSCTTPPTCTCVNGYYGDDCKSFKCDNTCQNGGSCTAPNTCTCVNGWTGATCTGYSCSQTCKNGGSCTAPNTCTCINNWDGNDCSEYTCSPKCGTHGKCTSPNICTCSDNYHGNTCEDFTCSKQCQNGGSCIAPDTCDCPDGYIGEDCSILACYDIAATSSNVCSGHGTCSGPNTCDCILSEKENYKGDECEHFFVPDVFCNGILSSEANVCNSKGSCIGNDNCECDQGYTGDFCQLAVHCDSIYHYNTSHVCSGNGICIINEENNPVGICQCNSGYQGKYCSQKQDFSGAITTGVMIAAIIGGGCILLLIIAVIAVVISFGIKLILTKKNRDSIRQEGGFADMKFYELNEEKSDEEEEINKPKPFVSKKKPMIPQPMKQQQSFGNGFRKQGPPPMIPKKKFSPPMPPKKKMAPPMIPKKSINNAGRFNRRPAGGFKKAAAPPIIPKKPLRPTKKLVPKKKFGGRMPPKPPMKFKKPNPPMIPKKQSIGGRGGFKKSPPMIPKKIKSKKAPPMIPKKPMMTKKKAPPMVPRGKPRMPSRKPNTNQVRVVQRYNSTRNDELSVNIGEKLTVMKKESDGWWKVKNSSGKIGYIPGNFCK